MQVTSPAFEDGGTIPKTFTRLGDNALPPLEWEGAPDATRSYALLVEDPDAPGRTFLHCLLYDIPADCSRIDSASLERKERVGAFARNDFGNAGYDGPEPPREHGAHRYQFRLAALDVPSLDVKDPGDSAAVWRQVCLHSLDMAGFTGVYDRA